MQILSTYTAANWNIIGSTNSAYVWGIGSSYPYLQVFPPFTISGSATGLTGTVFLVDNGAIIGSNVIAANAYSFNVIGISRMTLF